MSTQRVTLDNPVFAGRLRTYGRRSEYERRPVAAPSRPKPISEVVSAQTPKSTPSQIAIEHPRTARQPFAPDRAEQQSPRVATPRSQSQIRFENQIQAPSRKVPTLLVGMAILLFICGAGVTLMQLRTNNHAVAQAQQAAGSADSTTGPDGPDEVKPDNMAAYTVPANQPRYLSIPKLSVHARVRRLGTTAQNELQAPVNVHDAGWYEESAKPGDAGGAILIDGHVHGPTQKGVFYDLKSIRPGDKIQIERGDGKQSSFRVVKLQAYKANQADMAAALTPIVPGKLGLNLITCAGQLDTSTNEYQERLIVFATAE